MHSNQLRECLNIVKKKEKFKMNRRAKYLGSFVLILLGLVFSNQAYAADGSSGCGPGWYLFKENSLVSSSFRTTTNGFLMPVVTFGMTFGTSNCSQHKLVKTEKESLYFVTMNYFELKSEMAKGQGEYLSALANTLGCNKKAQARLNSQLKNNFKNIFTDSSVKPENTLSEVYRTIFRDEQLTQQCSLHNVG